MYNLGILFFQFEPVCCSMSSSNCCFLTCIQISQEAGQVVWYSHLFQNRPQIVVIHTVKGFGIVNKAEVDVFFWNSLAFSMMQLMLAIWSLVPLPFLKLACTSELHKPDLENFEHYFTGVWDEYNCAVVWGFFGIAFLRDWNENWPFPVLWPLISFPNLLAYWVHFELTHLKRPWCWERLKARGEGDNRRCDGWTASPTQWTWVWVNSRSWWWTGRPGVLRFKRSQRVGHNWVTELSWTSMAWTSIHCSSDILSDLISWIYLSPLLTKPLLIKSNQIINYLI